MTARALAPLAAAILAAGCCPDTAPTGAVWVDHFTGAEGGGVAVSTQSRFAAGADPWREECEGAQCRRCCPASDDGSRGLLALAEALDLAQPPAVGAPECQGSANLVITVARAGGAAVTLQCAQVNRAAADPVVGAQWGALVTQAQAAAQALVARCR